ncbi:recombinase family protein [bacterium]|nr:recombinase family protein [bacterium]
MNASPRMDHKVEATHLARRAYLYIRQSTLRQVLENVESGRRQHALRRRAVALGWSTDDIETIDEDQGRSGASSAGRRGFQRLVAEVGTGHAGIVMGLEVSRLARNNADWHRLLEICALTDTLILDEDGVYDPAHFNDRLLLGLKGTMSEAELHVLRARLRGGILNKARRGELKVRLPTGLVFDSAGRVVLDPDRQVQDSFRLFFRTFARTGTAHAVVRHWRDQDLPFPRRLHTGPYKGDLVWGTLSDGRAINILRNPRYAGAFCYGRRRQVRTTDGKTRQVLREQGDWIALLPEAHEGYISWTEYEENLQRLRHNAQEQGCARRTPPREGPALLQGLVVCGRCGRGMTVRYHKQKRGLVPEYVCGRAGRPGAPCRQSIPGAGIDDAVGRLLLELVSPVALEVSLAVQQELEDRLEEVDQLHYRQVERARQEAELARRRYLQVHPDNRLVADVVEADWNEKLRALDAAQRDYERQRQADRVLLDERQRERVLALASDFREIWESPATDARDRKRMVRLLIEDVTLHRGAEVTTQIRFRGGATRTLTLDRAKPAWQTWVTPSGTVARIDELLDDHTYAEVAEILNAEGHRSGQDKSFFGWRIKQILRSHGLRNRRDRLRDRGLITLTELAAGLGLSTYTIKARRLAGTLPVKAFRLDDNGRHMYEDPGRENHAPTDTTTARAEGVQYET